MTDVSGKMVIQSRLHSGNILPLRPGFRDVARLVLESLPIVGDLILERYFFSRRLTACKGVYETFEAAQAAIPSDIHTDYDRFNESSSGDADSERTNQIKYEDYPVLFWLEKLIRPGIRVADLGGSTGGTFYAFNDVLDLPDDIAWLVAELPGAVELGTRVAEARGENRLDFTIELGPEHRLDEIADPIAQTGLDRIEPVIEEINRRLGIGMNGIGLRSITCHGVVSCPAS